jgi:UV DNA damage repair endonuclease
VSIKELEVHSRIFDLMGFAPSPWNKINIHVGGVYGNKLAAMDRFADVVNTRLSANCKCVGGSWILLLSSFMVYLRMFTTECKL